jgi:hypothetical protein
MLESRLDTYRLKTGAPIYLHELMDSGVKVWI